MSSTRLSGKRALITGASSGIGRAIAVRFAKEGASVAINYRSQPDEAEITRQQAVAAAAAAGHQDFKAVVIGADVADEAQIKTMFEKAIQELGGIDILINNAGIQKEAESDQIDIADYDRVLNVNLRGTFICAREALKHFLATNTKGERSKLRIMSRVKPFAGPGAMPMRSVSLASMRESMPVHTASLV